MAKSVELLIYDFDGVIADSEVSATITLQRVLAEHGCSMELDGVMQHFMGKREQDVIAAMRHLTGSPEPDLSREFREATLNALANLSEVPGARATIEAFPCLARCIASSSSRKRLDFCLDRLGMWGLFDENVFSAEQVACGKPSPDIFLFAAQAMGFAPAQALVIEDSVGGVTAARAAGMRAFGITAASHIQPETAERLFAAGAEAVFSSHPQLCNAILQLVG